MSERETIDFFPYRFDRRWNLLFAVLGVDDDDGVILQGDQLSARFGRFRVDTPLANVARTEVTGSHRWYTAVGLRLSLSDHGLTFGTNHEVGLCIEFRSPIPRVIGFRDHPSLWVSVADPHELGATIARRQRALRTTHDEPEATAKPATVPEPAATAPENGEDGESRPLEEWTKSELYQRAKELDVPGRSSMSKDELIAALRR